MSTHTFQGLSSERPSTRLHAAPGGNQSFNIFGGPTGDDRPRTRANPTFGYNPQSPFNKEAAPVAQPRRESKANIGSIDFAAPPQPVQPNQQPARPYANQPTSNEWQPPKKAPPRANNMTSANPFSNQPYENPAPLVKSGSRANVASVQNPLVGQGDDDESPTEQHRRARRASQTNAFSYAADSPFNPNNPPQRAMPPAKANNITAENPFSNEPYQNQNSFGIRPAPINAPSRQSPFSSEPAPQKNPRHVPGLQTSHDSPFVSAPSTGITSERRSASSVRLHAPPGGKTSITFG